MTHGDDWSDLAGAWTAADAAEPPTADLAGLTRRLRRRDRLARLNFLGECAACLVAVAVGVLTALAGGPDGVLLGLGAVLFGGFALGMSVWARSGVAAPLTATPADALRSALAQAEAGLRWARAGWTITWAGLAFVLLVSVVDLRLDGAWSGSPRVTAVALAFLAAVGVFYRLRIRRCRRRIADHRAAFAELEEGPQSART